MTNCKFYAIVFDLDDTIGHFEQFSLLTYGIESILGVQKNSFYINLLDLYPKFIRPGLINLLKFLKSSKQRNKCLKVIIYTNNNGPRSWTMMIKNYLEKKINYKIFDKVITKYDPTSLVNCRTTDRKTHEDLVKCTNLPANTKFLFLDDQYHSFMKHPNINYIHLYPYSYHILPSKLVTTFLESKLANTINIDNKQKFRASLLKILTNKRDFIVTKTIISKKDKSETTRIVSNIKEFLKKNKKTRKFIKEIKHSHKQTKRNHHKKNKINKKKKHYTLKNRKSNKKNKKST